MFTCPLIRLAPGILVCLLVAWGGQTGLVNACSVPVFRYSLERWPADPYVAVVFHRGVLSQEQAALAQDLEKGGLAGELSANVETVRVDLDNNPASEWLELWQRQPTNTLPALVLRYPPMIGIPIDVWSGPLTREAINRILDSPARREIGRRLVKNDCAVWVLLESGDPKQDTAAVATLEKRLKHLQENLKLQALDPSDVAAGLVSVTDAQLKVAFSTYRLSRKMREEQVFIRMLLGIEEDLRELTEPIAIPIFGRGRALFALVGKGIENDNIDEACYFLTGPCSCQVKELNPGVDMLMAMNWEEEVSRVATPDEPPPELSSLAGFTNQASTTANHTANQAEAIASITNRPPAVADDRRPPLPQEDQAVIESNSRSRIILGVVTVSALSLVVLGGATFFLMRRKP